MQPAAKTRNGSLEHPTRTSSQGSNKAGRTARMAESPTGLSPKVDRRTALSAEREKRRPPTTTTTTTTTKQQVSELESQLCQLQDDLKKAKEQLHSSELSRTRALQDADDARSQLAAVSSAEESRLLELRRLSQERDRSWQSELEAMQQQHAADSSALAAAMAEVHRLRVQLSRSSSSGRQQDAVDELLRAKLRASEESEAQAREEREECRRQLEASRATIDSLLTDGSKLMDSFSLVVKELEESRAKVKALEDQIAAETTTTGCNCSGSGSGSGSSESLEEMRAELEAAEARYQEEKILSTVETQCAYELMDQIKTEADVRHGRMAAALEGARSEVIFLKASLFDREAELRTALEDASSSRKLLLMLQQQQAEEEGTTRAETADGDGAVNLNLEEQLQGALQENARLKQELLRQGESESESESEKKGSATRAAEEAEAEATKKGEMETELRRLRVQAEQWRKAAETAMALLTVGKGGNGKVVERSESWEGGNGKYAGGLCEELDDDAAAARKNGNVLRRISGMWKK